MTALSSITAVRLAAVFFLGIFSSNVFSQATVRDSQPITPGSVPVVTGNSTPPAPVVEPSSSYNQAYQIQQLQQEVLELRGLLEEQAFQLKRLKQQRLDDYLDLDKRLSELSGSGSNLSGANNAGSSQNNQGQISALSNSLPTASSGSAANSEEEKKLYRKAIDQLLSQQDYKGAQGSFSDYLGRYPNGSYVPNVYYWQGQIYLTESNKSEATKSFSTLIDKYPDHQKAPDAKYKLATIYFDQGKKKQAKILLEQVAASDTDASRLAKAFLSNQYK